MAEKFTAAESIRRLAKQYEDMVAAADALEAIGKLEQVTNEQKAQAEAARKDTDLAKDELAKVKAEIKKHKEQAKQILDGAVADANDQAGLIQKGAEERAAVILKEAQDKAAVMLQDTATKKAKLTAEIAGLQQASDKLRDEIATLDKAKAEVISQYDDADKKLAGLKSKLKALMD